MLTRSSGSMHIHSLSYCEIDFSEKFIPLCDRIPCETTSDMIPSVHRLTISPSKLHHHLEIKNY